MFEYLKKQLGHIEWYIVALFFILLPAVYSTKLLDPALYSRFYALSAFLIIMTLVIAVLIILKKFKFRLSKVDYWVFSLAGFYVVWNFLAVIGVVNVNEAIFQSLKEAALMISFFYFYQLLRNNNIGREIIIKAIVLMSSVFIGIAIFQLLNADFSTFWEVAEHKDYYLNQALIGVNANFSGKNLFPMGLVLVLPFSFYATIFFNKFWKTLSLINILISFFFIFILSSKSAWFYLALFFTVIYVFFVIYMLWIRPKENNFIVQGKVKLALFVLPILIVIGGLVVVIKADVPVFSFVKDKVLQVVSPEYCEQSIYSSEHPTSAQTRRLVWAQSLQMAKDNPILGVGPGHWRLYQPSYGLNAYEDKVRQGEKLFQRPHNDFLWIAAETGFVGLLAYLLVYILILVQAYRNFSRNKDNKVRIFNALAFASLLGFAAVMLLSFPRERIIMNAVYLMLFALVLNDAPFKKKEDECGMHPMLSIGIVTVLLGLLVFNIVVARDIFKGEKAARYVKIGILKKNWTLILRAAMSTEGTYYTLDPFNVPMYYYKGVALSKLEQKPKAKDAFQEAIRLCPYNLRPLNNLATSMDLVGKRDSALIYFQRALDISPKYKDALVNMAIVNAHLHKVDLALDYLKQVEEKNYIPPKYEESVIIVSKMQAQISQKQLDREKLLAWFSNENKIKATYSRFKNGNEEFHQILVAEMGKN